MLGGGSGEQRDDPLGSISCRERFGQELQALGAHLQAEAPPGSSEARSSVSLAAHSGEALRGAVQRLRAVLQGLRDEAAREQTEVPIVGSTRCLLGPGGELRGVLTAGQHVTLTASGFAPGWATEAVLGGLFGRHGRVQCVRLVTIGGVHTARVTLETAAQAAAAQAALHNMALPEGGRLTVAGYQPHSAQTLFRPANLLHLSWSGGRPSGVAFVEFARGSAPVAAAVREANVRGDAGLLRRSVAGARGRRGMLKLGGGAWMFCQASKASPRVLQLKVCGEEREQQGSAAMQALRDPEGLKRTLAERFGAVTKVTVMQASGVEPEPSLRREQQPAMLAARLRSLLLQYGSLVSLDVKPYDTVRQLGRAFASFSSAHECAAARQALDGSTTAASWLSRQPLRAHSDVVCRLRLDARCFEALRGRLAFEVEKLRAMCADVRVSVKSLEPSQQGAGGGGGGGGASIKLQGSDLGQVVRAKRALEAATSGRLVTLEGAAGGGGPAEAAAGGGGLLQAAMLFVLSPPGKALIKQIEAEHSAAPTAGAGGADEADGEVASAAREVVHIRWDRALGQLRIYGSNDATIAAAELRLRRALQERQASLAAPSGCKEALSQPQFRRLLALGGQAWLGALCERHSLASASLGFVPLGVRLLGEPQALEAARGELLAAVAAPDAAERGLPAGARVDAAAAAAGGGGGGGGCAKGGAGGEQPQAVEGAKEKEEEACCPVCFCPPEAPHKLLLCSHTYCQACVQQLLLAAASSNQLPAKCCSQGCGSGVSLRDCLALLGPEQMERVHRSAFQAHVAAHPEAYGCCLTPDCGQVYAKQEQPQTQQAATRSGGGGAGHGAMGTHFACTCCLMSWCTSCQVPWHAGQSCGEFKAGCRVAIEKNSGCNHMTCTSCKGHFCWICGEEFNSGGSTYDHLVQKHGGIFDY
ncbi:hypothetical protein TSOC_005722 [Tetrabaena socialis]|uniref:Uncharacterized protein n=1 Tax=Tetrabaena socialis TaxID=47790 RepID=A0A2J8A5L5_9CHLO|nr:hypothetical protein TSOC_005722 [Tetrabaena socialis]|eukprot:PNH07795.1 hypothetical protein TSOC_005722 [Tetrabaena socialis]